MKISHKLRLPFEPIWKNRHSHYSFASIAIGVMTLGVLGGPAHSQENLVPRKKLIWSGWNTPISQEIAQKWQELDKLPFDGITIDVPVDPSKPVRGNDTSGNRLSWNVFGPKTLKVENFKTQIADLKSAQWKNISALFVTSAAASYGQDQDLSWFDEARWATINNNWRTLATIAKQGKCKGILFDPEHYDYGHLGAELFDYEGHRAKRVNKSFVEYRAIARRRGRELMQGIKDVYPDITMLCFFAYDLALYDDKHENRPPEKGRYSLLSAFLDGMLEGSDARTKWTDSWEFAYGYKQRSQFLEAYHSVRQKAMRYSTVPDLYASKMRAGFGLMLDYNYSTKWSVDDISRNHFSPAEWKNTVRHALEVSDEYVIVYTQAPNFMTGEKLPDAYRQATAEGRQAAEQTPTLPEFNAVVEWKEAPAEQTKN